MRVIAKWSSTLGAHWVEATVDDETGYGGYHSTAGSGSTGTVGEEDTIAAVQQKVDARYFLPDKAKTSMRRTL